MHINVYVSSVYSWSCATISFSPTMFAVHVWREWERRNEWKRNVTIKQIIIVCVKSDHWPIILKWNKNKKTTKPMTNCGNNSNNNNNIHMDCTTSCCDFHPIQPPKPNWPLYQLINAFNWTYIIYSEMITIKFHLDFIKKWYMHRNNSIGNINYFPNTTTK